MLDFYFPPPPPRQAGVGSLSAILSAFAFSRFLPFYSCLESLCCVCLLLFLFVFTFFFFLFYSCLNSGDAKKVGRSLLVCVSLCFNNFFSHLNCGSLSFNSLFSPPVFLPFLNFEAALCKTVRHSLNVCVSLCVLTFFYSNSDPAYTERSGIVSVSLSLSFDIFFLLELCSCPCREVRRRPVSVYFCLLLCVSMLFCLSCACRKGDKPE